MNGIIITKQAKQGQLCVFRVELRRPGEDSLVALQLGTDASDVIGRYGIAQKLVTWISGPAASKKLARKFSLAYRKRAPGAGRPRNPKRLRMKRVTIWMQPAKAIDFQHLAEHYGRSLRVQLEIMVAAGLQSNDQ